MNSKSLSVSWAAPEDPTMFQPRLVSYLCLISMVVILIGAGLGARAQEAPILHCSREGGRGQVAADPSGNPLGGVVSAAWADSPSRQALSFDGQPAGIVKVQ